MTTDAKSERDFNLQVRVSLAEKDSFERSAQVAGVTLSAWVRDRLRRAAREELQSSGVKVPFLESMKAASRG